MKPAAVPQTIDEYIAAAAPLARPILEKIRSIVRRVAPDAEERISYRMPAFRRKGRMVIYFAAFKGHIGIFPPAKADKALAKDLAPYRGDKGNLRFPLDERIPYALITRVVRCLAQERGK